MSVFMIMCAALLAYCALGASAYALATATISPGRVVATTGATFDAVIVLNPDTAGTTATSSYSARIGLNYRPDLLEVTNFTYASGVVGLSQPGYDVLDNTRGTLVKTAGFPGGITKPTRFGTVTFRTKIAGTGLIAIDGGSLILDANNNNIFARNPANGAVDVTIIGSVSHAPSPQALGTRTGSTIVSQPGNTSVQSTVSTTSTVYGESTVPTTSDNTATSGSVLGASASNAAGSNAWIGVGIGVVVLLIIIGIIYSVARGV